MPRERRKKTIAEECGVDAAIEVLDCIAGDLPDGAYFAMAKEMGLDPCDLAEDAGWALVYGETSAAKLEERYQHEGTQCHTAEVDLW